MTIVPELTELYRELGGTEAIKENATSVDILKLISIVLGGDGKFDENETIATLITKITKVMGLADTEMQAYSKATIFDYDTADLQSDIDISGNKITGTLKWLSSGQLVDAHGEGNFVAIEAVDFPEGVTSAKLGMFPTYKNGEFIYDDSGLQEIINDPDKGGAYKITDKTIQSIKLVTTDGEKVHTQVFDISGLTCLPAEDEE